MKKIRFIPDSEYALKNVVPPLPAKDFIPEWYRLGEYSINQDTGKVATRKDKNVIGGLKSCAPFLDAMISGYFLLTWMDVEITKNDGDVVEWRYVEKNPYTEKYEEINSPISMINERTGEMGHTIPRPPGFSNNHLIFNGQWGVRLPRGWSLMVVHPSNRFELPFFLMSGFMDSDQFWNNGNIPFFIKKGFVGIIPKNTPIAQLIPIKRASWVSYIYEKGMKRLLKMGQWAREQQIGYYKKKIWYKKEYV